MNIFEDKLMFAIKQAVFSNLNDSEDLYREFIATVKFSGRSINHGMHIKNVEIKIEPLGQVRIDPPPVAVNS